MSAAQMVCHLADTFRGVLGERPSAPRPGLPRPALPRWRQLLLRTVALYLPFRWPHGMKTRPEVDQEIGGTPPGEFVRDVAELERLCARFLSARGPGSRVVHYLFGPLSDAEWCRWAYRHMDHHLRQFGA